MKIILKHFSMLAVVSLFLISTAIFSQKPYKSVKNFANNVSKSITDTLKPLSFVSGTLTLDTALAGGYVCGTNAYQDIAKSR